MATEAEQKWHVRLLKKSNIEEAIARFHAELDDATRMFQVRFFAISCAYMSQKAGHVLTSGFFESGYGRSRH